MRKIEFRGWDIDNKRWVYGFYVHYIEATPYPISTVYEREQFVDKHSHYYIVQDGFSDWGLPRPLMRIDVDPDSVGQWTAKRDKFQHRIYEGDIVAYKPDRRSTFIVEFTTRFVGSIQVIGWNIDEPTIDYEIIGNKYENKMKEASDGRTTD